ncbi:MULTISPECIES: hypothetical protein [Flavobacterium]|nr:hypothetical protein [Flavobacterium sp. N1846]
MESNKISILQEFSPSGKLVGTNEYVIRNGDTIMHGKFVNYNEQGNKIAEGQFIDGDIYGKCVYYYDNKNIKSIYYRQNSKITLESIDNYPDGKTEQYTMYANFGEPIFIIKYDKSGVIDSYKGNPQLEIYQHKVNIQTHQNEQIQNSLKVGDKLKYSYMVANIPNAKRSFTIENIGIDNAKAERILKNVPPTQIDVEEVLTKKGKNTIRSIVRYEFNDKVTPVFTDTLSFDVNVN